MRRRGFIAMLATGSGTSEINLPFRPIALTILR